MHGCMFRPAQGARARKQRGLRGRRNGTRGGSHEPRTFRASGMSCSALVTVASRREDPYLKTCCKIAFISLFQTSVITCQCRVSLGCAFSISYPRSSRCHMGVIIVLSLMLNPEHGKGPSASHEIPDYSHCPALPILVLNFVPYRVSTTDVDLRAP